jgi:dTDP-L-rhamnose 4-epimerase
MRQSYRTPAIAAQAPFCALEFRRNGLLLLSVTLPGSTNPYSTIAKRAFPNLPLYFYQETWVNTSASYRREAAPRTVFAGLMKKNILITGGAGFIGSHLADELIAHGYHVRVLDNLSPQVHGPGCKRPDYLNPEAQLQVGDVRDPEALRKALKGIDAVFHFAAIVGVGQSMYEVDRYVSVNDLGTAVLWQELINRPVEKLIVASSMSVYGEGLYKGRGGALVEAGLRPLEQLRNGDWEISDSRGRRLQPVPTPETKQPCLASVYALNKYSQERLCLILGGAYNIPTAALRFFNVFGRRQALSNPYTGVLAIFAARLLNNNPPLIFEDGQQKRDFVSVYDVATACRLAFEVPESSGQVFNIGSGRTYTVQEVADKAAKVLGKASISPQITKKYRVGDIRHCFADITLARNILGYRPTLHLEDGLTELAEWLEGQIATDQVSTSFDQLSSRGLTV